MDTLENATNARCSRRTLVKGAGAVSLGVALAGPGRPRTVVAQAESIQDILNITATTEAFGVTALGEAVNSARQGNYDRPIPEPVIAILEAARAQEQFHLEFFQGIGGELLTDTFTVPPAFLTSYDTLFSSVVDLETREVAAQVAAFPTFTAEGRSDLVKVSFQYAAEEAEHRVLANYALGSRPPNDQAFSPALYATVADHLAFLQGSGLIGGAGVPIVYPGTGAIDASNVTNRTPDGPEVNCAPGLTMPRTGTGGPWAAAEDAQELARSLGLFGLATMAAALAWHVRARSGGQTESLGDQV